MGYLKSFVLILWITAGLACRNQEPPPDCITGVKMYSDRREIRHDYAGYPVFPFSTFVLDYPSGIREIKVYASRPPRMIRNASECSAAYKWILEKKGGAKETFNGDTIQLRNLADGLYILSICDTSEYDCKRGYFTVGDYEDISSTSNPAPPPVFPQPRPPGPNPQPDPPKEIEPNPEPTPPLIPLEISLSTGNDQLYTREFFSVICKNCSGDAVWYINGSVEQQKGSKLDFGVDKASEYRIKVCDPSPSQRCNEMSLKIKDDRSCSETFTAGPIINKGTNLSSLTEDALPHVPIAKVILEPRVDCKLNAFDVASKNLGNRIEIELRENNVVLQDNITANITNGVHTVDFKTKAKKPYILKQGHKYELTISGTYGVVDITELKPAKGSSSDCKISGSFVVGNVVFCKME
jgi:hypothetical protein